MQFYKYASMREVCTNIQVCMYGSMQFTGMQACKYASMHVYASMQVCTYMQVCKYASLPSLKYLKICSAYKQGQRKMSTVEWLYSNKNLTKRGYKKCPIDA